MQNHVLVGRITGLRLFSVPEFGTRASFKLECGVRGSVTCAVEGDVAREFLSYCREGDRVTVTGIDEPRPATASFNTPWSGRFRVRALRVLESASLAA